MADHEHRIQIVEAADGRFHAACACGWRSRDVATPEVARFHGDRHADSCV